MLYRSRPLMVALISSALASAFIFACSSEEEEPNEPGVGGTSSNVAGSTSKGGGTAKGGATGVGNGGTTTGKGGTTSTTATANGGSSPGVGGSGVGGSSVGPVAGNAGRGSTNPQGSCVQGVNTGDNCNASIDTTECVRSTRTCTCSAQTQKWACTPNGVGGAGNGGNSGRGGSAGAPANIAGNAGLAGFAGAGLPVAANCRRNSACSMEGQFCDKSMSVNDPRYCTCTNGDWACVDVP